MILRNVCLCERIYVEVSEGIIQLCVDIAGGEIQLQFVLYNITLLVPETKDLSAVAAAAASKALAKGCMDFESRQNWIQRTLLNCCKPQFPPLGNGRKTTQSAQCYYEDYRHVVPSSVLQ